MDKAINYLTIGGTFHVQCLDKDGNVKWEDHAKNAVTKAGLDDLLEQYFRGGANPTTLDIKEGWALGVLNGVLSVNDTHASHPGWVEFTSYLVAGNADVRPQWAPSAPALQKLVSPTLVDFDISKGGTISGVFLAGGVIDGLAPGVDDADLKGSSSAVPLLWAHAPLNLGNAVVTSGDILRVTYCVSASSA